MLRIRPYRDGDERVVLDLLAEAFGTWPHGRPQATPIVRWRYADVGGYRAVRELHDGRVTGLAVFASAGGAGPG